MSYAIQTSAQNKLVTASTAQVTLCQFDITALPGVGRGLATPFVILAEIKVLMTASPTPDHSSRVWRHIQCWERTGFAPAVALTLLGTQFTDDTSGGVIGSSTQASPTYDVSGTTLGRVRIIPMASSSMTWFTRMDLTILQG